VFENRVLRRIFGPTRDEVTGECRKTHNEEDDIGKACSTNGREDESVWITGGKAREKELLERPRRRWLDNIKMELRDIRWGGMDWIGLVQDRHKWRTFLNAVLIDTNGELF
jgi:hypothetical protein